MPMVMPDGVMFIDGKRVCPHNRDVFCPVQVWCDRCGWYPPNDDLRNRRVREVLARREERESGLVRE